MAAAASRWRCTTCKAENHSPHADRPPEHCHQCGKVLMRENDPDLTRRIERGEPVATALRLDAPVTTAAGAGHGHLMAEMLDDVDRQHGKRKGCSGAALLVAAATVVAILL